MVRVMRKYPKKLKAGARAPAGRRPKPRAARRPAVKRTQDYAKLVEANELPILTNSTGVFTMNYTTQLSDFQRAQEVAHAYKYYRCAKIELEFIPYANFALTNGTSATRLPQLYFTVDRVANMWSAPSEQEMLERGIKARLFRSKCVFSYRPNLLQHVQLESNQPADGTGAPLGINVLNSINSIPLFNKWLPTQQSFGFQATRPNTQTGTSLVQPATNPYALKYYGSVVVIDIEDGTQQQIGDVIQRVTWEFKGPRALVTTAPVEEPYFSSATSTMTGVPANTQPTNYP